MKSEHIKPSDEFRDDVERALKLSGQTDMRVALNEICEKYGHFWARTVQLGGLIIKTEKEHKESHVRSTGETIGIDVTLETVPMEIDGGVDWNNEMLNQNSSSNSDKSIIVVGGHEIIYKDSDDRGIKSL